jgi:hypothetical protein
LIKRQKPARQQNRFMFSDADLLFLNALAAVKACLAAGTHGYADFMV